MDEKTKLKYIWDIFRISEEIGGLPTFINRDAADLYISSFRDYGIEPFIAPVLSFQTRPKFDNEIGTNVDLPEMFNIVGSLVDVECNGGLIGLFYNQDDAIKYKDQRKTNNIKTSLIQVLDSTHTLYGLCNGVIKDSEVIIQPHKFTDEDYHLKNSHGICEDCKKIYRINSLGE